MTPVEIREHIELSRRASAGMTAELAAPHVALADLCLAWFAALDAADGRELTEEALASERGRTEVAERQLRAALGLKHPADLAKGRCELGFEGRITRSRGCPTKHIRSAFEAGFAIGLERGHDTAQVQAEVTEGTIQEDLFVRDRALDEHMAGIKEADVLTDTVTLTFDRAALDAHLASIERTWSRVGRVGQAHRCAIARDPAHPHSAGEAAALMLGLPSPYPDRAAGDRSLTIGGGQ